jgi:hypothetical protein
MSDLLAGLLRVLATFADTVCAAVTRGPVVAPVA